MPCIGGWEHRVKRTIITRTRVKILKKFINDTYRTPCWIRLSMLSESGAGWRQAIKTPKYDNVPGSMER